METQKNEAKSENKLINESNEQSKVNKEVEELTNLLKRLQADFENYKKRVDKESKELCVYHKAELIAKLLPVLDTFESALKNTKDEGLKLIHTQLMSVLEKEGLRHIKARDEKLDPFKHEVLLKENSDKEQDTILEELQKGYMFNNKVLRHTKVKVSGGKKQ